MKNAIYSLFLFSAILIILSCEMLPISEEEYNNDGSGGVIDDGSGGGTDDGSSGGTDDGSSGGTDDGSSGGTDDGSGEGTSSSSGLLYNKSVDYILAGEGQSLWYASGPEFGHLSEGNSILISSMSGDITGLSWIDSDRILISSSESLWIFETDSSDISTFYTSSTTISSTQIIEDYLVVMMYSNWVVIRLSDKLIVDSFNSFYSARDVIIDQNHSRLFYLTSGVSPSDIHYIDITNGNLDSGGDSIYHGTYSNVGPLHLYPDGSRIIQGNGYVFDTSNSLKIYSKIPHNFKDMVFYDGDIMILTNDGSLLRISSEAPYRTVLNIKSYQTTPFALIPWEDGIHVLTLGNSQTFVDSLDDTDLAPAGNYEEPNLEYDSNGMILNIPIEKMVPGNNQSFYFSSGTGLGILNNEGYEMLQFSRQQISSLNNESSNTLIFTSGDEIFRYQIDTNTIDLIYTATSSIYDACMAGKYLVFICSGFPNITYALDTQMGFISDTSRGYYTAGYALEYEPINGMILGETRGTSPKDIEYWILDQNTGEFTEYDDSMYHGSYSFIAPYRFFPDGSRVMSASGQIFTTEAGLPYSESLPNACNWTDMFFYDDEMILLSDNNQLIRADSTSPYSITKVIHSFSTDSYSMCLSGSFAAVVTKESTTTPSYRVKIFTQTEFMAD